MSSNKEHITAKAIQAVGQDPSSYQENSQGTMGLARSYAYAQVIPSPLHCFGPVLAGVGCILSLFAAEQPGPS